MPTPTIEEMLKSNDPKKEISKIRTKYKPNPRKGYVWLGVVIEQKKPFPSWTEVIFENGWLGIPIEALFKQTFILGATRSGKTEFQKNIIMQLLEEGSCDVVVVDGKGDQQFARDVCAMGSIYRHTTPVLKLGWGESAIFSGFDGDSRAIYNRLIIMLSLEPLETDADHYRSHKREILQLICGLNTDLKYGVNAISPPRSFQELEKRVTDKWLMDNYMDSAEALDTIRSFAKGYPSYIQSLRSDISSATTPFLNLFDPRGFKLGEYPVSFFSVDEAVAGFDAGYFFRFMAGYAGFYLSQRHKPMVFFCDEFALFGAHNVVKLLNTGGGKGGAFILATQSVGTLGGEQHITDQIIDGPNLKFLFKSDLPADVVRKFGTERVEDTSHQTKDGEVSGVTIKYVDKFNVDINKLKHFQPGECMFEYGGLARIQTSMTPELPPYHPDMEVKFDVLRRNKQSTQDVKAPIPD